MKCEVRHLRLGEIIEPVRITCGVSAPEVVGVDINHRFIPTRANLTGVDTSKYLVVPQGCFACNLMHIGRDERIPLAYNDTGRDLVITHAYYVFRVRLDKKKEVLPLYLFLYICRSETDRYTWLCTDSSVRGNLPESRLFDITIPVPDIKAQQRLVDVWSGLDSMKQDSVAQAAPLMGLCMSYLKKLWEKYPLVELDDKIQSGDERNKDSIFGIDSVRGISIGKVFIDSKANMDGVPLGNYKVVKPREFAFVTVTSRNGGKISLAYNDTSENYIVSATYEVFRVSRDNLLPEYLYLWFLRPEFDRYARFHSWGSARETFNMDDMKRVRIPIPPKKIQQAIVDIYTCAKQSQEIGRAADLLRQQVGPALIQKAMHP